MKSPSESIATLTMISGGKTAPTSIAASAAASPSSHSAIRPSRATLTVPSDRAEHARAVLPDRREGDRVGGRAERGRPGRDPAAGVRAVVADRRGVAGVVGRVAGRRRRVVEHREPEPQRERQREHRGDEQAPPHPAAY